MINFKYLTLFLLLFTACFQDRDYSAYESCTGCGVIQTVNCIGLQNRVECRVVLKSDSLSDISWNSTIYQMVIVGDRICSFDVKVRDKVYKESRLHNGKCVQSVERRE